MNRLFITALAAALLAAPLANAQEWPKNHKSHGQPPHSNGKAPPRGPSHSNWGPHRGPDRPGYYHGYHGYHDRRPGYRRHSDGLWYPAAAFAIGAIIGGALNN